MRRCTFAAPLMALAAFTASDASARTASDCLAAPKGAAPQGSHWYYRWDREGQRKCWYVAAWKGRTARDTIRIRTAQAQPPVPQALAAQQRVSDASPATWSDEAVQQREEDRIRRLLYGTEQVAYLTEQPVKADRPAELELRPSLAPVQTADAGDGGRAAIGAASVLRSKPADAPDEVTRDTAVLVPPAVAAQTGSAVAPAQMTLYVIGTLAIAGGLLHMSVKLAQARRRRSRIERRSAYLPAASRPAQRALPPDRIRRFA
jgi:hypothetical protein